MAKKWTAKEEQYLMKHYGKIPNKELAEHFGVSPKAVANKMHSLRAAEEIETKPTKTKASKPKTAKPKPEKPKSTKAKPTKTKPTKAKPAKKPAKPKITPVEEEPFTPLSSFGKKKKLPLATSRKKDKVVDENQPPEYIPTTIMIMTEDGWQPIKVDKRKIQH